VATVVIVFLPLKSVIRWLKVLSFFTATAFPLMTRLCSPPTSVTIPDTLRSWFLVTEPSGSEDTVKSGGAASLNKTDTVADAFIVTVHIPVPVHGPAQPAKVQPDAGVAVSDTTVPPAKQDEQFWPQSMPAGMLTTEPLPDLFTVSVYEADALYDAVTVQFAVTGPVV
jgi:hypothetical protein